MKILLVLSALIVALSASAAGAQVGAGAGYGRPGTITVSDPTPEPEDVLGLIITGCRSDRRNVPITIAGQRVGMASIDATGGFSGPVTVPAGLSGDVAVRVACDNELSSMLDVSSRLETSVPLAQTGSGLTIPLARIGAVAVGLGALIVYFTTRRRPAAAAVAR